MNKAELTSYKLNLEPNTRYTREEVQALLPDTNYSVKELPLDSADHRRFSGMQVQQIKLDMSEPFAWDSANAVYDVNVLKDLT